jgi:hypothetical protein
MPLDPKREQAIRDEAERRGVDPDEAVKRAGGAAPPQAAAEGGKPTNERLLIGHLPFIKVRELRSVWLGLDERIADDEMMCGEFAVKYGGGAAPAPAAEVAE